MLKAKLIKQKRIYTLLIISSLAVGCLAQTQKGFVKTLGRPNQKGVALSGVTIRMKEAHNAVLSKDDGTFSMQIQGESYALQQVQKSGYELNEKGVIGRKYAYSAQVPLTIVMVSTQQLQSDKQRIENNAYQVAEMNYKAKMEVLEKQKADNAITSEQYRQQIQELQDKFEKYQSLIDGLADHYAHVDYDELDEKEREINLCIENGDLEQADQLLQQLGIQQRITDIDNRLAAGLSLMDEAKADMATVLKQQEKDAEYLYQLYTIALAKFDNEKARTYIETRAALDTTNVEWQIQTGKFHYEYTANYPEALSYFRLALIEASKQYGMQSEFAGQVYTEIGNVYLRQGMIQDARDCYERAFNIAECAVQNMNLVSSCLNNIGMTYLKDGSYRKSIEYLQKSFEIKKQLFGENNCKEIADSYYNIGMAFFYIQSYSEALDYYQKSLAVRKQLFDDIHQDIADVYYCIGLVYLRQGDIDNSLELFRNAMMIYDKIFGEKHPSYATCIDAMGGLYSRKKEYQMALDCFEKSYTVRKDIFGDNHPQVANSLSNIGTIYDYQENYDKAMEYYSKALEMRSLLFNDNHPDIAISYNNIGELYFMKGDYQTALNYVEKAFSIYKVTFGEDHSKTKTTLKKISVIKSKMVSEVKQD